MSSQVIEGDCVEVMRSLDDASVDAVVCDPPYGLEFMGKEWDRLGDIGQTSHAGPRDRDGSTVFGRQRVAFSGSSNRKCANCRKWEWDYPARKCTCDAPDFPNIRAHQARIMQEWHQAWATEALRVLRPGGHLLAFGGTRTYHRLACAVEDAGFEIRDSLIWLYGSGFPKSLDVSKAIDKANGKHDRDLEPFGRFVKAARERKGWTLRELDEAMGTNTAASWWEGRKSGIQPPGVKMYEQLKVVLDLDDRYDELIAWVEAEREKVGEKDSGLDSGSGTTVDFSGSTGRGENGLIPITAPATPEAVQWQGWGTALKPSHEPVVVARKPLSGTVAANVLAHGTGALNVDGCRVDTDEEWEGRDLPNAEDGVTWGGALNTSSSASHPQGRWPSNVILSPDSAAELDEQSGEVKLGGVNKWSTEAGNDNRVAYSDYAPNEGGRFYDDTGGASRFFYTSKASRGERNAGLEGFEEQETAAMAGNLVDWQRLAGNGTPISTPVRQNVHPTVKPIDLMRWLCRLVTPPGGTVLDPFTGSGTTGIAAHLEGFDFIGIEREAEYAAIAKARIEWWAKFPAGTDVDKALGVAAVDRVHSENGQGTLL